MNINATISATNAIRAIAELHNNPDDISAKNAIRAAGEDRAAFWSTSRNFLDEANNLPLTDALRLRHEVRPEYGQARLLNTLIPLNPQAVAALDEAGGSF